MERRRFFRLFAGATIAVVVAPSILREEPIVSSTTSTTSRDIRGQIPADPYLSRFASTQNPWDVNVWQVWYDKYGKDFNIMNFCGTAK